MDPKYEHRFEQSLSRAQYQYDNMEPEYKEDDDAEEDDERSDV